uniref:Uncharacterized protein n=1 Tax=Meloidogyne enterolobii TaxID=390850 RepID=A0A6V7VLQ9_MELEN|nr:unnamed protein product [Meloidogyne enterolobii]
MKEFNNHLYLFYYNLPVNLQQKLELLINKEVISDCVNSKNYLEEFTELIKIKPSIIYIDIPPHEHKKIVNEIKRQLRRL